MDRPLIKTIHWEYYPEMEGEVSKQQEVRSLLALMHNSDTREPTGFRCRWTGRIYSEKGLLLHFVREQTFTVFKEISESFKPIVITLLVDKSFQNYKNELQRYLSEIDVNLDLDLFYHLDPRVIVEVFAQLNQGKL